jgi:hypothetical protein
MKKNIMIAAVLFSGILFAQNTKPQLEVVESSKKTSTCMKMVSATTRTFLKRKTTR